MQGIKSLLGHQQQKEDFQLPEATLPNLLTVYRTPIQLQDPVTAGREKNQNKRRL